jgi:hypothetical protein
MTGNAAVAAQGLIVAGFDWAAAVMLLVQTVKVAAVLLSAFVTAPTGQ